MYPRKETVSITSDGSGDGTGYTSVIEGRILAIEYVKDGTSPYDSGVDFTITTETTGQSILTVTNTAASTVWRPRVAIQGGNGSNIANEYEPVYSAGERVKIVIAEAAASKVGSFNVVYG